ncbi:MAG: hypothetical protein AB8F34_04395 [Akkermansiaceae bacterium]
MPDKKTVIGRDGLPRTVVKSGQSKKTQPDDIDWAIELQVGSAAAGSQSKITAKQMLYLVLAVGGLAFVALAGWGGARCSSAVTQTDL